MITKEIRCFFVSPIFYIIGSVFLFIAGLMAHLMLVNAGQQALRLMQIQNVPAQINLNDLVFRQTFFGLEVALMFILPILTMRLFAEERKLGTLELLLTSPIGINELISAKFISVLIIYLGLLGLTGITPLVLSLYASFNWNPILTGYLALILQGSLFLAIGILVSAATENQIIAAFLSFGIIFIIWLLGGLGNLLGDTLVGHLLSYLSFTEHFNRLVRGLLDVRDVVYYITGTALALFIAHRVVDSHRW